MPTPWLKRIRRTGQLTVHNRADSWKAAVDTAIATFNNLGFGVKLVEEKEEKSANIVVKLSKRIGNISLLRAKDNGPVSGGEAARPVQDPC